MTTYCYATPVTIDLHQAVIYFNTHLDLLLKWFPVQELWHHNAGNSHFLSWSPLETQLISWKIWRKKKDLQSEKSIGNKWNQVSSLVVLHLVRIISYLFIIFSLKKCIVTVYLGIVTVHFLRLCETQSMQLIAENNLMCFSYCKS